MMNASLKMALAAAVGFATGYVIHGPGEMREGPDVKVLTRMDTVRVTVPEVMVIQKLAPEKQVLARADDDGDSVEVLVPQEQRVYAGEDYRAYVSGYMPRLDSVQIVRRESVVTRTVATKSRFSVGIQAGYGLTTRGFQPYIGVGVSIRIL